MAERVGVFGALGPQSSAQVHVLAGRVRSRYEPGRSRTVTMTIRLRAMLGSGPERVNCRQGPLWIFSDNREQRDQLKARLDAPSNL